MVQEEHCFMACYYDCFYSIEMLIEYIIYYAEKTEMKGEAKSNIIFMLGVIMMHGGGEAFPTDFSRQIVLQWDISHSNMKVTPSVYPTFPA